MNGSWVKAFGIGAILILVLATVPAGAEGLSIRPGLWETTTTIESAFMPAMPPRRSTECVRAADYDLDRMLSGQGDCRIIDQVVTGDTVTWQMTCATEGGPVASGDGELTSQGDRVEGRMTLRMEFQGKHMDTKTSWTGKRLGDC
jgi:hypothetical protein